MNIELLPADTAALLARLSERYPELMFDTLNKFANSFDDYEDAPDELITFGQSTCVVDPMSSECSRFAVDPLEAYGITREDAEAIRAHNKVRLA